MSTIVITFASVGAIITFYVRQFNKYHVAIPPKKIAKKEKPDDV